MPAELQEQVQTIVGETKERSGWPARRTLKQLGISPASYYRWRQTERSSQEARARPSKPVQVYEATDEEPGLSLEETNEAEPGGRGEGLAAGRDLGHRLHARADRRADVFFGDLPG